MNITILSFLCLLFFTSQAYGEIGGTARDLEKGALLKQYKFKFSNVNTNEGSSIYQYAQQGEILNSIEVFLGEDYRIRAQSLMLQSVGRDRQVNSQDLIAAFLRESSGGKISSQDADSILRDARKWHHYETKIADFFIKAYFLPLSAAHEFDPRFKNMEKLIVSISKTDSNEIISSAAKYSEPIVARNESELAAIGPKREK